MAQRGRQDRGRDRVDRQGHGGDPHRRAGVLAGVEPGASTCRAPGPARRAQSGQHLAGGHRRRRLEGAALEEHVDDRLGQQGRAPTGRGQRQQQASSSARLRPPWAGLPSLTAGSARAAAPCRAPTPDDAQRQLVQPVGVERDRRRRRRGRWEANQLSTTRLIWYDAGAHRARADQAEQAAAAAGLWAGRGAEAEAVARGRAGHPGQLHDTRRRDAPGQDVRRRRSRRAPGAAPRSGRC